MQRVVDRWPRLAQQILDALHDVDEPELAAQVDGLVVHDACECGQDNCQSFYTAPPPDGAWVGRLRNPDLPNPWAGMLVLDVVDGRITFVEVLDREPLD